VGFFSTGHLHHSILADFGVHFFHLTPVELDPKDVKAYFLRGIVYYSKYKHDMAITDFNKVIELEPNNDEAFGCRAVAYYEKGYYDMTLTDINQSIEFNPKDYYFLVRGIVYSRLHKFSMADADLSKVIAMSTDEELVDNANIVRARFYIAPYPLAYHGGHRLTIKVPFKIVLDSMWVSDGYGLD